MSDKEIAVMLCADQMGVSMDMSDFSERLFLQKNFYLMQLFGVDLGFRFNWYLRGPYCPALTKVAFEIKEDQSFCSNSVLKEHVAKRIQQFREWATSSRPSGVQEIDWLELLASLHYLRHIAYLKVRKTRKSVCDELHIRKNWYSNDQINAAWDALEEIGLIDHISLNMS